MMAMTLVVCDVDADIVLALKQRAAAHGRSVEAEHREMLAHALRRWQSREFPDVLASMPNMGEDADFDVRGA